MQGQRICSQLPLQADFAVRGRQRAVLGSVGGEFVKRERESLRGGGLQRNVRPMALDLVTGPIWRQLLADKGAEIGAVPT